MQRIRKVQHFYEQDKSRAMYTLVEMRRGVNLEEINCYGEVRASTRNYDSLGIASSSPSTKQLFN